MALKIIEFMDNFLVAIDNFSKFGRTVPLKNKNVHELKKSFFLKKFSQHPRENQNY